MKLLCLRVAPEGVQLSKGQSEGSISKLGLLLACWPHDSSNTRNRLQLGWCEEWYAVGLPERICQCYSAPLTEVVFRGGVRVNAHTSAVLPDSTCLSLQTQLQVELAAAEVAVLADLAHDHAWKADYTVKISVSCMRTPARPGKV